MPKKGGSRPDPRVLVVSGVPGPFTVEAVPGRAVRVEKGGGPPR